MKKSIITKLQNSSRDNNAAVPIPRRPSKSSPVIGSAGKALSELAGDTVIQIDPKKVHPSPYRDRLGDDEDALQAIAELKASIEQEGQKIPVLARPHPDVPGEYQLAYGHRRLRAILDLIATSPVPEKIFIRAHVRNLSDSELIREQSLENGVRENLSWIEKALWAVQLKGAGIKQREIAPVLGASESDVSRYFKVTGTIPIELLHAIGRSKESGRPKWMKLLEIYEKSAAAKERIASYVNTDEFRSVAHSEKLDSVLKFAANSRTAKQTKPATEKAEYVVGGSKICTAETTRAGTVLKIPASQSEFANWLESSIEALYDTYKQQKGGDIKE